MTTRALIVATLACLTGCADGAELSTGALQVETEVRGDTLVVRTLSGSAWGGEARLVPEVSIGEMDGDLEYLFGSIASLAVASDGMIYVVDRQVPELRAYDRDGVFKGILGSPGEGPGEIEGPDGGLAVLADGRVLVRDPGNGRIQVYSSRGEALATWPIRGGFYTSSPFYQTHADEVHTTILLDPEADVDDWRVSLVRIGPDGVAGDTLIPPDAPYEAPTVEARSEGSVSMNSVPFAAGEEWAVHPEGYFVHAVATDYALTLLKPDGPVRIERSYEPAPVSRGERAEEEARVTSNMRGMVPDWRWNGPAIPDVKPPFSDLYVGRDGRIWLSIHTAGVEVDDPDYDPTDPESVADR